MNYELNVLAFDRLNGKRLSEQREIFPDQQIASIAYGRRLFRYCNFFVYSKSIAFYAKSRV
jgi:hypothetical protein